jgi:hypothetical protein
MPGVYGAVGTRWAKQVLGYAYDCGEFTGLPLQDRHDQPRAQEGGANETPDVAPGDAVPLGQLLERSSAAGGEYDSPHVAHDRQPILLVGIEQPLGLPLSPSTRCA